MKKLASTFFSLLLLACGNAPAASLIWTGAGGNSWGTAGDWNPAQTIAASGDTLTFDGTSAVTSTTLSSASYTLSALNFSGTTSYSISSGTIASNAVTDNSTADQMINSTMNFTGVRSVSVGAGGRLIFAGIIKSTSASNGFTKTGAGALVLSNPGTNTNFIGVATVNAGSLLIGSAGALSNVAAISIGGGATLGFSTTGITATTTGTLALGNTGTVSILDFGSGFTNSLTFANSSGALWNGSLSIYNWSAGDVLSFGSAGGLNTSTQLGKISFYSDSGSTLLGVANSIDAGGVIGFAAVPEPSTAALMGAGALGLLLVVRRRLTA